MPPASYAQPMDQGSTTAPRHSAKASTKRNGAGGILFTRRTGHAAYIEYGGPFALEYTRMALTYELFQTLSMDYMVF